VDRLIQSLLRFGIFYDAPKPAALTSMHLGMVLRGLLNVSVRPRRYTQMRTCDTLTRRSDGSDRDDDRVGSACDDSNAYGGVTTVHRESDDADDDDDTDGSLGSMRVRKHFAKEFLSWLRHHLKRVVDEIVYTEINPDTGTRGDNRAGFGPALGVRELGLLHSLNFVCVLDTTFYSSLPVSIHTCTRG
jgi:hypothetical protein